MDNNLKKDIILSHYENPINKGLKSGEGYEKVNMNSESCIDNIDLIIKIEDNVIKDIRFDGEACAISTSATSIMIELFLEKTVEEALEITKNYEAMINEMPYDKEILKEANVYDDIYKQANRKKCALLPYIGIKKILLSSKGSKEQC
ncbi:MAG: SUF system NifU family Fe-S cluster assembly protein [Bacilli bacterium]